MNKKKLIIIAIIVVAVLILAGGGYWLYTYFSNKNAADIAALNAAKTADTAKKPEVKGLPVNLMPEVPVTPKDVQNTNLEVLAKTFAEKFGTYTNESNFVSIADLRSVMTGKVVSWLDESYLPQLSAKLSASGDFYRIVTLAPSAEKISESGSAATYMVSSQRTETIGTGLPRQFLQDLKIDFVKENNNWLVDGVYWQ